MTTDTITVGTDVEPEVAKAIADGLDRFNERHGGRESEEPIWVVCRDPEGALSGGLQAHVMWDWLVIGRLWVREDRRGRGIGRRLLLAAERSARERGCTRSQLVTLSFQAPHFYEKFGYREIGRLDDYPPGHSYIWMSKVLSAGTLPTAVRP